MRPSLVSRTCLAALCLFPCPAFAQEVESAVRAFAAAHDAGNGSRMAQVFDTSAAVTLAEDGKLRRGPRAVRAYLDSLAQPARLYGKKLDVQSSDVEPLGADYALAIARVREILNGAVWPGILTVVLHRTGGRWVILNMHKSGVAMAGE